MLIYIENDYDGHYAKFWGQLGEVVQDRTEFLANPDRFGLVCFTGGEDVSPALYGHQNLGSHNSEARDEREVVTFEMARKYGIPMTGICRGSQFLNVMCGGTMVQNLRESHGGGRHMCCAGPVGRPVAGESVQTFQVTSSHHQMSVLGNEGIFLGTAEESIPVEACAYDGSLAELDEKHVRWDCDGHYHLYVTEAFAYPREKIFAVQHHPEWQRPDEEAPQWTLRMIQKYCLGEQDQTTTISA